MKRIIIMCALLTSCATEADRRNAAEALGLSDYHETGPALFECSEDDSILASASFTATSQKGQPVKGVVCCGPIMKSCTVRF